MHCKGSKQLLAQVLNWRFLIAARRKKVQSHHDSACSTFVSNQVHIARPRCWTTRNLMTNVKWEQWKLVLVLAAANARNLYKQWVHQIERKPGTSLARGSSTV
jgi:hypothetical protein